MGRQLLRPVHQEVDHEGARAALPCAGAPLAQGCSCPSRPLSPPLATDLARLLPTPFPQHTGVATCKRAFVQFCYDPINSVIVAAMNDDRDKLLPMLEKLGIKQKLKQDDFLLSGKPLMKRVMQTWMPAHEALLEMMIFHLPSPGVAQKYRVENLYEGPMASARAHAPSPRALHAALPACETASETARAASVSHLSFLWGLQVCDGRSS